MDVCPNYNQASDMAMKIIELSRSLAQNTASFNRFFNTNLLIPNPDEQSDHIVLGSESIHERELRGYDPPNANGVREWVGFIKRGE